MCAFCAQSSLSFHDATPLYIYIFLFYRARATPPTTTIYYYVTPTENEYMGSYIDFSVTYFASLWAHVGVLFIVYYTIHELTWEQLRVRFKGVRNSPFPVPYIGLFSLGMYIAWIFVLDFCRLTLSTVLLFMGWFMWIESETPIPGQAILFTVAGYAIRLSLCTFTHSFKPIDRDGASIYPMCLMGCMGMMYFTLKRAVIPAYPNTRLKFIALVLPVCAFALMYITIMPTKFDSNEMYILGMSLEAIGAMCAQYSLAPPGVFAFVLANVSSLEFYLYMQRIKDGHYNDLICINAFVSLSMWVYGFFRSLYYAQEIQSENEKFRNANTPVTFPIRIPYEYSNREWMEPTLGEKGHNHRRLPQNRPNKYTSR